MHENNSIIPLLPDRVEHREKGNEASGAIVPEQFVGVGVSLDDRSGIAAEKHGDSDVGKAPAKSGEHRECKNNITEPVGADEEDSLEGSLHSLRAPFKTDAI
jgi:hypothetical protein